MIKIKEKIKKYLNMDKNESFDHIDFIENNDKKYNFYFCKKENTIIIVNFDQQSMNYLLLQAINKIFHKIDFKKPFFNKNIEKLKFKKSLKIICIDQKEIMISKITFNSLKEINETLKENSDFIFLSIFCNEITYIK